MEKRTIKQMLGRLIELQSLILKEKASIPDGATNWAYRHLQSLEREAKQLAIKCKDWGKGQEISICSLEASVTKFIVIYPTHDDEILNLLIQRDYKDHKILNVNKVHMGNPLARKDKKAK